MNGVRVPLFMIIFMLQIPLWMVGFVLNLFAVVSIALVADLRTLQFYLVNFQSAIESVGAFSWILNLLNLSAIEYYERACVEDDGKRVFVK